jgi:hypothetical protein
VSETRDTDEQTSAFRLVTYDADGLMFAIRLLHHIFEIFGMTVAWEFGEIFLGDLMFEREKTEG